MFKFFQLCEPSQTIYIVHYGEINKLPFLKVLVTRKEQGFRSAVYRKPTFTGHHLNFNSYNPYNMKKAMVCCLQHQAKAINRDSDAYKEEMICLSHQLHRYNQPKAHNIGSKKSG